MILYSPFTPAENTAFKQGYLVIRRNGMCFHGIVQSSCQIGHIGEHRLVDKLQTMAIPHALLFLIERRIP